MSELEVGKCRVTCTSTGRQTGYMIEMSHSGLNEHRVLKASDLDILQNKVNAVAATWELKWQRARDKQEQFDSRTAGKQAAEERTREAEQALESARGILAATLKVRDEIDWQSLEDHSQFTFRNTAGFPHTQFDSSGRPVAARKERSPRKPDPQDAAYQPHLTFFDRLFSSLRAKKEAFCRGQYEAAFAEWRTQDAAAKAWNTTADAEYQRAVEAHDTERTKFIAHQEQSNEKVQKLKSRYLQKDPEAVVQCCELVLDASRYPDYVAKDFALNCNSENGILVVDYQLPEKAAIPRLMKVVYIASKGEEKETFLRDADSNKLYDGVLYQLALRTIHELFEADSAGAIRSVVFNGWLNAIDPATGRPANRCLLSLQASKEAFEQLALDKIEPKACFKQLKGVAAAQLSNLVAVRPILQLEKDDPRFVDAYDVANTIDPSTNLAAMDWEDFEHLIREIFEKEFAHDGAEVKVTRASSDGGVDAVIFDPDPIRGGKIVLQAKRYTATVGVSAVRDLYGTVMNEGANKGILVTTADYGLDAYEFSKGKPLTLLTGNNLLHLLEKHGHRARIDIREARLLAGRAV